MKKSARIVLGLALAGLALAQQVVEERVTVVNVEIPVRVFQGDRFVDNLTISDFELLENGKPQTLEAVYLVKRRAIERRDEVKRFAPQTNRSFFLIFEISEYTPRIGDALDYFLRDVIMPGDSLTVGTPMKSYRLKPKAFEARSREEISAQLKTILRRDTIQGSTEYRDIIQDLEGLAQAITVGLSTGADNMAGRMLTLENAGIEFQGGQTFDEQLNIYAQTLSRLDVLRSVDQGQLLAFADVLKTEACQKYVYMFYEREFVPKIQPRLLYQYIDLHQDRPDINQTIQGIFEFYKRDVPFDVAKVKRSFADASTADRKSVV